MTQEEITNQKQIRQQLYDSMIITSESAKTAIIRKTNLMIENKERYLDISHKFVNPGFKWWLVAVLHEMECSQNFRCYLGNGQHLDQVTTIVPIGRGPFATFEEGALDAIKLQGLEKITDWSMGNLLWEIEGYNGHGYMHHGINSPYLFAGSNQYIKGDYVSDGHFDPDVVSHQIGVALLLQTILNSADV